LAAYRCEAQDAPGVIGYVAITVVRHSSSLPLDFTPRAAPPPPPQPEVPRALTVGELDRAIKRSLDASFEAPVWVEGEVTGARPATSGHLYFGFKDDREDAAIDVAIYKASLTPRVRAMIVDGARIRLHGKPAFWAPRGRLQFVADRADPVGRGALLEALERLKAKLTAEGLFDVAKKRPLPVEPRIIGVVTSRTGAVIHDICKVAFRRGGASVLLAPALVQGAGAAASIRRAMAALARVTGVDVIVIGRGGGSSDDLAAFNDEELVRAVAACPVAVISAVGHEVDVTLTDFAADARAATPSQAAEMVVPDARARRQALAHCRTRLHRSVDARVREAGRRLEDAHRRLGDHRFALASRQQTRDDRVARLGAAVQRVVVRRSERLVSVDRRLSRLHPSVRLGHEVKLLGSLRARAAARMRALLAERTAATRQLAASLDAMSPLKVLGRGYAIATTTRGRAVRDAADVVVGDSLQLRVARARLGVRVVSVVSDADRDVIRGGEEADAR
jgi:exodeoxyribonuclease VII large subunit